jgi:hypothetical protein
VTERTRDHERVRELLGREPRGRYEVVVRDDTGDPVVLRNDPLLDDGTPMPTRYWLVGPAEIRRIGRLESIGGVDAAEAAVDPDELIDAHDRYAAERDAAIPPGHTGPRPSGGVGGTRVGVKCLHAHWGWFLAGGDDPIGRWIEQQLAADDGAHDDGAHDDGAHDDDGACVVTIGDTVTEVTHGASRHEIPWGATNLTDRWLRDDDPPRPDALTNALGSIEDHLDDLIRLDAGVIDAPAWVFVGPTITSLAWLEAGEELARGDHEYPRTTAEEVFRLVATEAETDRAQNPGLPSRHVDTIVATSCIVQASMRRFRLDTVTLRTTD